MRPELSAALAAAFLGGAWDRAGLRASGGRVLGRRPRWLRTLVGEVLDAYRDPPADRPRELARFLEMQDVAGAMVDGPDGPEQLIAGRAGSARPVARPVTPTRMLRNPWRLPVLDTVDDLADLVGLPLGQLLWFCDTRGLERGAGEALRHYRVSHRVAATGGVRVLEAPKPTLRHLQRRVLAQVLDGLPPHEAAHGFRPGRSVAGYAAPHAGKATVLRLDLEGFFAGVTAARVHGVLRSAGYPEPVAYSLTGLCTTSLSRRSWNAVSRPASPDLLSAHWRLGRRLAAPHLPQGAPTSPALANLVAYHLDVRLSALARSWGADYTRYADDLALSGGRTLARRATAVIETVAGIVREEGFVLNERKTAVLPRGGRQVLGGLVVNERPHVGRREVDALRAVLHNCAVHGAASQNRAGLPNWPAHLRGRVSWVAQHDPVRGARLLALWERVDWDAV